jgi:hypothetical protein
MIELRYLIDALQLVNSDSEIIATAKGKYEKKPFRLTSNGNKRNRRSRSRK